MEPQTQSRLAISSRAGRSFGCFGRVAVKGHVVGQVDLTHHSVRWLLDGKYLVRGSISHPNWLVLAE